MPCCCVAAENMSGNARRRKEGLNSEAKRYRYGGGAATTIPELYGLTASQRGGPTRGCIRKVKREKGRASSVAPLLGKRGNVATRGAREGGGR